MTTPAGHPATTDLFDSPASRKRRTRVLAILAAVLGVVVLVATVLVVFTASSAESSPAIDLAAKTSVGRNPFAALTNRGSAQDVVRVDTASLRSRNGATPISGTTAGLYGGSGGAGCDPAALAQTLGADFAKANAWAKVFGISVEQIPYYLDTLTPVTLTADTWVTNHSFSSGSATPFQSILESGTAVLVDSEGVPRVRCSCGNPLKPPASTPLTRYRPSGTSWPNYSTRNVVYVQTRETSTTAASPTPGEVPAALTVRDPAGGLLTQALGALLNLASLPPLTQPLPTAASLNVPFTSSDPATAAANGIDTKNRSVVAQESAPTAAAQESGSANVPQTPVASDLPPTGGQTVPPSFPAPPGPTTAPPAGDPAIPTPVSGAVPGSPIPPVVEATPTPATTPPTSTTFTGSGGAIASFTYMDSNGQQVSCTVPTATPTTQAAPTTETSTTTEASPATGSAPTTEAAPAAPLPQVGPLTASCGGASSVTVNAADLTQSAVAAATGTDGVWTLRVNLATPVRVVSAAYASS